MSAVAVTYELTNSEQVMFLALVKAKGTKTIPEIAADLGKKASTITQMLSTIRRKWKDSGRKWNESYTPKRKAGTSSGRPSNSISMDKFSEQIAALESAEVAALAKVQEATGDGEVEVDTETESAN